jgi:hypothetical protein
MGLPRRHNVSSVAPGQDTDLLDAHLPHYHFSEHQDLRVGAPPAVAYQALKEITASDMPLMRVLFALRTLPSRLRRQGPFTDGKGPLIAEIVRSGFAILHEEPGAIVLGAAGKFWDPAGKPVPLAGAAEFAAFGRADSARAVLGFAIRPGPAPRTSTVHTETRVWSRTQPRGGSLPPTGRSLRVRGAASSVASCSWQSSGGRRRAGAPPSVRRARQQEKWLPE